MSALGASICRLLQSAANVSSLIENRCAARENGNTVLWWLLALLILGGSFLYAPLSMAEAPSDAGGHERKGIVTPDPIGNDFQALITHWYTKWPTIPFSTIRMWDTGTFWSELNPGPGQYDWTVLDGWLSAAQMNHATITFTLGMTPQWASSDPNNTICHIGPGECAPPDDLNPDGTGPDQHWKEFVAAIAQHAGTQISAWEVWNEPNNLFFWTGTYAQLARMAQDARSVILSINPKAKMLNAGTSSLNFYGLVWWEGYAAAGGLQWADVIAIHGDVNPYPPQCGVYPEPETFLTVMSNLRKVLVQYGKNNKPVWDTESSWGPTNLDCFTDQDLQAAFLARYYLLHRSTGVRRFYWRAWIDGHGGLYTTQQGLNKAGVAYGYLHDWLMGNALTSACTAKGTIWTCNFTGPNGYVAAAIWDTGETCNNGDCGTKLYPVAGRYVDYRTLDGGTHQINNNTVPIGAKPIWVEN